MKKLFLLTLLLFALPAYAFEWNTKTQGDFVTAICAGYDGDLWVGTEDFGVWKRDAQDHWQQFGSKQGLGDDTVLALATFRGQIWAGLGRGGLGVWDGRAWKNYGLSEGLPSERVTDLATDADKTIWVATEAGLCAYKADGGWVSFSDSRLNRPLTSVACEGDTVLVGTDCEGILISRDGGQKWDAVTGSRYQPTTATGSGLPSSLINDVAVDSRGVYWVATVYGVASSSDEGQSWTFLRGQDWKANVEGSAQGFRPKGESPAVELLSEDWVTHLEPTSQGQIWLGFRQKGAELRDVETGQVVFSTLDVPSPTLDTLNANYVRAIFPLSNELALVGRYGGGLGTTLANAQLDLPLRNASIIAALPEEFPVLEATQLSALVSSTPDNTAVPSAAFYNLDRRTQGDWTGRYGDRYSALYAVSLGTTEVARDNRYSTGTRVGPHYKDSPDLYTYVSWLESDNRNVLLYPFKGIRRMAEINDGTWQGDKYPFSWEGPDIWTQVTVPEGWHRLALYYFNKDGHDGNNRYRDYVVRVKNWTEDLKDADEAPDLSHARVRDFWQGTYVTQLLHGPAKYLIKTERNRSHVTICSAALLDKVSGPADDSDSRATPFQNDYRYVTEPTPPLQTNADARLKAAYQTWTAFEEGKMPTGGWQNLWAARLQCYRAALKSGAEEKLLYNWRWKLALWKEADRNEFNATVPKITYKPEPENAVVQP